MVPSFGCCIQDAPVKIPLNRHASTPPYLQIRDRLGRWIQNGKLTSGERLPSIRTLAKTLDVNKLTVIEAYSFLVLWQKIRETQNF